MKLHVVGGFLGSGKTTAIIQAARKFMSQGIRVGVITNDQGKYLVDTAFVKFAEVPTMEVSGGCFCCNFGSLDVSLDQLLRSANPEVVFAEAVGSCADLVATVVKPLQAYKNDQLSLVTLSVFVDARLIRRRLRNEPMPFSEDVTYLFDKQLAEAGLIIVNKIDLLKESAFEEVKVLLARDYPFKKILFQSSLSPEGVEKWLQLVENGQGVIPEVGVEIDYARYGHGEAQLAWLDEVVTLRGMKVQEGCKRLIHEVVDSLHSQQVAIGHLKFLLRSGDQVIKVSIVTLDDAEFDLALQPLAPEEIQVIVNARVEMPASDLHALFLACLERTQVSYVEEEVNYFHPGQPQPTHRIL